MDGEEQIDHFDEGASRSRDANRRHGVAFIGSVAAHALILLALVFLIPEIERPHHDWVLAYLVEFDQPGAAGGGVGAGDAGANSSSALHARDGASPATPRTQHHTHHRAAPAPAMPVRAVLPRTAAIAASPVPGAGAIAAAKKPETSADTAGVSHAGVEVASASASGGASGTGGGDGVGGSGGGNGSGAGFAHVAYGQNPGPNYPIEARRRAQQGTVLLRIEVGVDGSAERVELAQSSGFDSLDESAMETVRTRWRFVPALRDGTPIESWCLVPIRFALTEARAN